MTPLVAYVGEVLLRASGGRWIKPPRTYTRWENVYDPAEMAAYWTALLPIAEAAAKRAGAEARARRASASDVALAINMARDAAYREVEATKPKPIRCDLVEHTMGSINEPVITASNGRSFQPYAIVIVPMVEPSKRLPLRVAVGTHLHVNGYPPAPKPTA